MDNGRVRTNSNRIAKLHTESWGNMCSQVSMTLLITVCFEEIISTQLHILCIMSRHTVFGDIMEIVPSDDDCAGHFSRHNLASQDTTANGNIAGERALLVYNPDALIR